MSAVRLVNPATEGVLREMEPLTEAEVETALAESVEAFRAWRPLSLESRLECLRDFEGALHAAREILAAAITAEMGKTLKEAHAEVDKCVESLAALRTNFTAWKATHEYRLESGHEVLLRPLGPLLGIMPWNFPVWQVIRFAAPAILNGNTVLLKHAPNTWGVAEFVGELFRQAFPYGVYQNLNVDVPLVEKLIADPRLRGVSLTGSRRAGESVGALAGRSLKKCVLELGGSDAYVLLDDADLELAARTCAAGRLVNAGQSCVAAKRFIVTKKNAAAFTELFRAELAKAKWGDPTSGQTQIGPLARKDLRDQLAEQVQQSVRQGARVALGGAIPAQTGYYYPPTLLIDVRPGQVAFDDELFGPVAALIEARDENEAIALANRSRYGLGGGIFSRDVERARRIAADEFEAGMVFVNEHVKSGALVPFGGIKDSGLGRELGREGAFEFTNVKLLKS